MGEHSEDAMAVITLGYKAYVLPVEAAITIAKALAQGERYERKYRSASEGGWSHHVFPDENVEGFDVSVIPRSLYLTAKLAGKPE